MSGAETLARFARDFGVPYLRGKRCMVSDPIGGENIDAVRHGLGVDVELSDACEEQLVQAALFSDTVPAPFDEDAGTLLYAVHELFSSCHPQTDAFYARAHTFCQAAEAAVLKLPRTYDPGRVLTRHLVVERAFKATRTDVHVAWWTGKASFYGREAPTRLTAWPGLRRVDVDRRTTPMWRLAMIDGDEETRVARVGLMTALLNISPLTRLTLLGDPVLKELGFALMIPLKLNGKRMSPLFLLEDRGVARAVTDALLERGVESAGAQLGLALLSAVREGGSPHAMRRAAELCVHLHLVMCMAEGAAPGVDEAQALRSLLDDDLTQMSDPVRVYWSTVRAAIALDGTVLALPDVTGLEPAALDLWERARARLEHKHVGIIGDPLMRELGRRLPSPRPASPPPEPSAEAAAEPAEGGAPAPATPSGG